MTSVNSRILLSSTLFVPKLTFTILSSRSRPTRESLPPHPVDVLHKLSNGNEHIMKDSPNIASENAAQQHLNRHGQALKRHQKTHPSSQLIDYLDSPSTTGPYTGLQDTTGQIAAGQRQRNMKECLQGVGEGLGKDGCDEEEVMA
jgi:hypothetical protein